MSGLETPGFHHIAFVSRNHQRTCIFYEAVLGLTRLRPLARSPFGLLFGDEQASPGSLIGFFHDTESRKGHWGVGGIHHVALAVVDHPTLLRWKRWLTDHGIGVSGPYDRGYFHSLYFQDPDGHILELATLGPGYDFDEPADALGTTFIEPDEARLRGERDEAAIRALTHPEPVDSLAHGMRLRGIHHVTGITRDLGEAHDVYTRGLGLSLVKKTVNQDDGETRHDFWARYDGATVEPASSITHFGWPNSSYVARPGTGQTHHVSFRAGPGDDLHRWRDHLLTLGLEPEPVEDMGLYESIRFRMPDGLLHEIATDIDPDALEPCIQPEGTPP